MYDFTSIPELGRHIYTGIPAELILAPTSSAIWRDGLLALASAIPVALLALYYGHQIARPARMLSHAVRQTADRCLDTQVQVTSPSEIAARAAEQGKSFAVVAQHVRDLAERCKTPKASWRISRRPPRSPVSTM